MAQVRINKTTTNLAADDTKQHHDTHSSVGLVGGKATAIGPYGAYYLQQFEREMARKDEGAPESEGHARKRAMRKMSKILLRDLWIAWGKEGGHSSSDTQHRVSRPLNSF
jgi:hypothetical protein